MENLKWTSIQELLRSFELKLMSYYALGANINELKMKRILPKQFTAKCLSLKIQVQRKAANTRRGTLENWTNE